MAANFLVEKLLLFAAAQVDFVFFFREDEQLGFFWFDLGNWLWKDEFFSCVALLHQMAAEVH